MSQRLRRAQAPSASLAKMTEWISQVICTLYLMFYVLVDLSYSLIWFLLIVGSSLVRLLCCGRVSSIRFVLYIALIYLYLGPTIGLFVNRSGDALVFLALFVLAIDAMSYFSSFTSTTRVEKIEISAKDKIYWTFLILFSCVGGYLLQGSEKFAGLFAFTVPFALSLVFFERLVRSCALSSLRLMLGAYFVVVGIYIAFYWSGFGRLVIGAFILMPVLIADHHRDFGLRIWHAIVLAPFLLAVSHLSRYGGWGGLQDIAGGSAAHHLVLTLQLIDSDIHKLYGGFGRFVEQFSLLFLNWVPRDVWPGKPVGIGSASVDEWIGRVGYGDGFSVSLGMFGEQIYIFGSNIFYISWVFVLCILIMVRCLIGRLSISYIAPVVIFDVNLISFVWGGSGTFGSRGWFFIVPVILFIFIFQKNIHTKVSKSHLRKTVNYNV